MSSQVVLPPEVERLFRENPYYYLCHPNWRVRQWPPDRVKFHLAKKKNPKSLWRIIFFELLWILFLFQIMGSPAIYVFLLCNLYQTFRGDQKSYELFLREIRTGSESSNGRG